MAGDLTPGGAKGRLAQRSLGFDVIDAYSRPVRLGEGVALSGTLCGDAIDRARVTRARHIAIEACHRACNGEGFLGLVKTRTASASRSSHPPTGRRS